ncbi:MAG: type IV toxin-antitoxin system AbiEi family antitoxin domain-containing protein [Actinobacteria bacterium]|nr:type IV toxin-antitoxin system AbiEi family antitoxin domain-containing protein [Actinomycetota bacterium]MBU1493119.1 type IV toxin-antitoxin system AbiEi family antitoxin domain-containing protein [Actinomycetota bacterium]
MAGHIQDRLWEVALDQYGYVTSRDARALGIAPIELVKLAARDQLERVGHGIYRFPQLPVEPLGTYMLAALWAGEDGVLSHDTALDIYELCDVNPAKVYLTTPHRKPRKRGGETYLVHRENLEPEDVTRYEGLPIVTPATAVRQAIENGLPSRLATDAIRNARSRGLIDAESAALLSDTLERR